VRSAIGTNAKCRPSDAEKFVQAVARRDSQSIDALARRYHDKGLYSVSVALKKVLLNRIPTEAGPDEQAKQFQLLMASGAGLRRYTPPPVPNAAIRRSPGILLHAANDAANRGYLEDAELLLRQAEELRGQLPAGKKEASESHYRMRVAQIRRTETAGRSAINFARNDSYMTNTALLFTGHILVPTEPNRARSYFELILEKGSKPSWLYRAECMLGLAAIMLRTGGKVEEAYVKLVVAQYINSLLNHQNSPHPEMHEKLAVADLTASDIIVHDPVFAVLTRQHRTALRRAAIIESGLQRELLTDLILMPNAPQFSGRESVEFAAGKRTRVLVLGPDTKNIRLLRTIQDCLLLEGYRGILVKEEMDIRQESNEEKVVRLAASCRFVVIELTTPAGQIDELSLLARLRHTISVLHRKGKQATWMQSDYSIDYPVKYFPYERSTLSDCVRIACRWAEDRIAAKEIELSKMYPWQR
jgi:hypothetical protein